jgi:hypothetical protein
MVLNTPRSSLGHRFNLGSAVRPNVLRTTLTADLSPHQPEILGDASSDSLEVRPLTAMTSQGWALIVTVRFG